MTFTFEVLGNLSQQLTAGLSGHLVHTFIMLEFDISIYLKAPLSRTKSYRAASMDINSQLWLKNKTEQDHTDRAKIQIMNKEE